MKEGGEPVIRRYWSVLDSVHNRLQGTDDQLAEQLEALMVDAFRLRMVSDVPGGHVPLGRDRFVVVTALLQKHCGNIHTFTIGFSDDRFDEASHARRVAEHLGTNHTARVIAPTMPRDILPRWADLYDEPFADSSGIPTYLVSKLAGERVKVVLSADGGDELFAGYNIYANMLGNVQRRDAIPLACAGWWAPACRCCRSTLWTRGWRRARSCRMAGVDGSVRHSASAGCVTGWEARPTARCIKPRSATAGGPMMLRR